MRWLALLLVAACGGGPSIPTSPDGTGMFDFDWELRIDGFGTSCGEVGASNIEIIASRADTSQADRFPCVPFGGGTTRALPVGNYTLEVRLLDGGNTLILALSDTGAITDGNVTGLGRYIFELGTNVCDASSCGGCCSPGGCVFVPNDAQCGLGGVPCDNCADVGLACDVMNGFCTEP